MKRFLCVVLALFAVVGTLAVGVSAGHDVSLTYDGDYYHLNPPNITDYIWYCGGGTSTTASYPNYTSAFFKTYSGFEYGQIYTLTGTARFNAASISSDPDENNVNIHPYIWYFDANLLGEQLTYVPSERNIWSHADPSGPYFDKLKASTYCYFDGRDIHFSFVFSPQDKLFYDQYAVGFGFNGFSSIHNTPGATITYTRWSVSAVADVDEGAFYQANLDALQDLQDAVGAAGSDIVNSVDEMGNQISGSIDDLKVQSAADAAQAHQDAQNTQTQLQQNANQAHQDAVQAHQDAQQAHQDAVNAPQNEHDFIQGITPDADSIEMPSIPDLIGTAGTLVAAISTTATTSSIKLPQGNVPFFDQPLWNEQTIDFSVWLNDEYISKLILVFKFLFSGACIFMVVSQIIETIKVAFGLSTPEPENPFASDVYESAGFTDEGDHWSNGKPITSSTRKFLDNR